MLRWFNNKPVYLISDLRSCFIGKIYWQCIDVPQPYIVKQCNSYMGEIDKFDMMSALCFVKVCILQTRINKPENLSQQIEAMKTIHLKILLFFRTCSPYIVFWYLFLPVEGSFVRFFE